MVTKEDTFNIDDIKSADPGKPDKQLVKQNPCVTVFKYKDRWAVKPNSGDNYIFPTLGVAIQEAKEMLQEQDQ